MPDLQKSLGDQEFITRTHSLNSATIWINCTKRLNFEGFGNIFQGLGRISLGLHDEQF